jgi:hypothetical protein
MADSNGATDEAQPAAPPRAGPPPDEDGPVERPGWSNVPLWMRVVVFVAGLGLIGLTQFFSGTRGIGIGLALGWLLAAGIQPLPDIAEPFFALGRSLAPLLLPLLLLVVVGTFELPWAAQVGVVLAIALASWQLIVRPDLKRLQLAPLKGQAPRERRIRLIKVLSGPLFAVAIALVVAIWLRENVDQFESRGGVSTFLLLAALILWGLATVLRLLSFATCWLRGFVALVLGLAALRLLMAAGILPLGRWFDTNLHALEPKLFVIAAVVAILAELLLESVDWGLVPRVPPGARHLLRQVLKARDSGPGEAVTKGAASLGLGMALLATAAAGGAALAGLIETSKAGGLRPTIANSQLVEPTVLETTATDAAGRDLAARYFPVLAFTDAERWAPISVDNWLLGATLNGPALNPPWTPGRPLPTSCRNLAPSPCFKLSLDCAAGVERCAPTHPHEPGDLQRNGVAYVRILRRDVLPRDGSGDVFTDRGPFRDKLGLLVQYWFFYPYDRWTSPLLAGRFVQEHQGDWEAVTLGLENPATPLFIGYSSHCGGHWERWSHVEKADRDGHHALVAVATGSQANYPKADRHQPPNWTSCNHLPSGATTLLTYALNVRDTTAYDWEWYPSALVPVDGRTHPMNFPGRWGEKEQITLTNFKSHPFHPGVAPLTPTYQPLWQQPVKHIFCGSFEPRDCKGTKKPGQ